MVALWRNMFSGIIIGNGRFTLHNICGYKQYMPQHQSNTSMLLAKYTNAALNNRLHNDCAPSEDGQLSANS